VDVKPLHVNGQRSSVNTGEDSAPTVAASSVGSSTSFPVLVFCVCSGTLLSRSWLPYLCVSCLSLLYVYQVPFLGVYRLLVPRCLYQLGAHQLSSICIDLPVCALASYLCTSFISACIVSPHSPAVPIEAPAAVSISSGRLVSRFNVQLRPYRRRVLIQLRSCFLKQSGGAARACLTRRENAVAKVGGATSAAFRFA
jgi:hypothetical protein